MPIDPRNIEVIDDVAVSLIRARSGGESVLRSLSMFAFGRDLTIAAIRERYPDWTQEQVRDEARRRIHGE